MVEFELRAPADVRVEAWDLGGERDWTGQDTSLEAGAHALEPPRFWDALDVGIYEFRAVARSGEDEDTEATPLTVVDSGR